VAAEKIGCGEAGASNVSCLGFKGALRLSPGRRDEPSSFKLSACHVSALFFTTHDTTTRSNSKFPVSGGNLKGAWIPRASALDDRGNAVFETVKVKVKDHLLDPEVICRKPVNYLIR